MPREVDKPQPERTARQRMLDGDLYLADDPELVTATLLAAELQQRYASLWPADPPAAATVLRQLLGALGQGSFIKPPLYVDYGTNISIGERTFINYGLVALDVLPITIGSDVQIGPNTQLLTPTHPLDAELRRAKWEAGRAIVIEDNVWLGGGVIVLPGVTIGRNSVVGAGSVVTRDVPPNVLVVGNPAGFVRRLDAGSTQPA